MNSLLGRIIDSKRRELEATKKNRPLEQVKADALSAVGEKRSFSGAILSASGPNIIAELKKASPTAGLIREYFDIEEITRAYNDNGASAISVLTEKTFFQGDLSYIQKVKGLTSLPILRKDFIIDPYQVFEAKAAGADAFLLIVAALEISLLEDLISLSKEINIETLVEVHDEYELETALTLDADVIGVNNRNLKTGKTDVETSVKLAPLFKTASCKISESGIKNRTDIEMLMGFGYKGFLIGESLVRQADPGKALRELKDIRK